MCDDCGCECGCDCECHKHGGQIKRRYQTKTEQIAELQNYLSELSWRSKR